MSRFWPRDITCFGAGNISSQGVSCASIIIQGAYGADLFHMPSALGIWDWPFPYAILFFIWSWPFPYATLTLGYGAGLFHMPYALWHMGLAFSICHMQFGMSSWSFPYAICALAHGAGLFYMPYTFWHMEKTWVFVKRIGESVRLSMPQILRIGDM